MKRKKGIPLVALVIFIALLVAIILTCVIILGSNKNNKSDEPLISNSPNSGQEENEPSVDDEVGEEITSEDLINSDNDIKDAYKLAGNKKTFAKYAVYASGGFDQDNDNIRNELKLQLAMAQVTNSDMDKEGSTKSVSKDKIDEYAQKIFKDGVVEYKDFSLFDSDTNFIDEYKTIGYTYNKNTANYEVQESDVEESNPPEVTEIITKAVKYNSKIEVYVKPIFIDPFFSEQINAMGCQLFAEYDFQTKDFVDDSVLTAFSYTDYEESLRTDSSEDADGYVYDTVSQYVDLNKIKDYKYTFIKTDDGYKLKSFEELKSRSSGDSEETNTELSEQEKAIINAKVEAYVGSEKSSTDVKSLIEAIISINESATDESQVISVKFDDTEEDGTDKEKLVALTDSLDSSKTYEIKATYKSRLITSVTIKTN